MADQNPSRSQAAVAFTIEIGSRKAELNISREIGEPPGPLAVGSSMQKRVPNTSITESFDAEQLSHVEQPATLNSSTPHDVPLGQLNNRWVKRLKLRASDSLAHGTKSSKTGSASSGKSTNDLFHKIMNYKSCSDPILIERFDSGQTELNRNIVLLSNLGSPSLESLKKHQDLSHPWIRRWCHHQAANQRPKPAEPTCDVKRTRRTMDQKKRFPSISAMALMGKASNCFRPCEFRKKGSVIVWHTDDNVGQRVELS